MWHLFYGTDAPDYSFLFLKMPLVLEIEHYYIAGKPLFSMVAGHRLGMLSTSFRVSSGVTMWHQVSINFSIISFLVAGFHLLISEPIFCHRFPIGLRSGDGTGQVRNSSFWSFAHFWTIFSLWHGILSSWESQSFGKHFF